jgi:hypothetical protein
VFSSFVEQTSACTATSLHVLLITILTGMHASQALFMDATAASHPNLLNSLHRQKRVCYHRFSVFFKGMFAVFPFKLTSIEQLFSSETLNSPEISSVFFITQRRIL